MDKVNENSKEVQKVKFYKSGIKTEMYLLIILAILFIVLALNSPVFLTASSLKTLLRQASIYGIVAIGMFLS